MADKRIWLHDSPRGDEAVVGVRGEVDLVGAPELRAVLDELLRAGEGRVVIDLTEATLIDSTALGVLVHAQRISRGSGGSIVLRSPRKNVRHVLEITGLDQIFTVES